MLVCSEVACTRAHQSIRLGGAEATCRPAVRRERPARLLAPSILSPVESGASNALSASPVPRATAPPNDLECEFGGGWTSESESALTVNSWPQCARGAHFAASVTCFALEHVTRTQVRALKSGERSRALWVVQVEGETIITRSTNIRLKYMDARDARVSGLSEIVIHVLEEGETSVADGDE